MPLCKLAGVFLLSTSARTRCEERHVYGWLDQGRVGADTGQAELGGRRDPDSNGNPDGMAQLCLRYRACLFFHSHKAPSISPEAAIPYSSSAPHGHYLHYFAPADDESLRVAWIGAPASKAPPSTVRVVPTACQALQDWILKFERTWGATNSKSNRLTSR
ncbi:hypothetical protein BDP55DRAFT_635180 [Colletotrichum godetiae]|uniref:Uncharacterized protein n=1 Tax=Colletotrichum godetiae TaxID=1209918 RepID=A0AAJ0AE50_9PEZI|nr:uncharacterized protein BDP55DRAFT_635180 [Colletotrichum godetiae]KAK1672214.1 hypothetical protein BDP55DRAFT_635180 [Colletotrichum godetiae]